MCSAVVIALAEGVFITMIPFLDAADTSTLSTPIPALPINLKSSLTALPSASVTCFTSTSNISVKLSVGAVKLITSFTITVPSLYCTNSSVSVIAVGADTCRAVGKFVVAPDVIDE